MRHSPQSEPRRSSTLLILWILALAWLPAGFLFKANSAHFGWGFFPAIVWVISLPILGVVFGVAALIEIVRHKVTRTTRLLAWCGLSLLYWLLLGAADRLIALALAKIDPPVLTRSDPSG